ncbi:oligosaccharide repeat unit polymerase [Empedobacter falsenii]
MLQIYLGWWGINMFISTLNPFNLYEVSFNTYILLILNVFCFLIGYIFYKFNIKLKNENISKENAIFYLNKLNKSKPLLILFLFFAIYLFLKLLKYIAIQTLLNEENIRMVRYEVGLLFSSGNEIIFYNFFVETISFFSAVYIVMCISLKKTNCKLFYLSFIIFGSYSLIGAGRGPLIMLIFYYIFFNLLLKKERTKINQKKKQKSKFFAIAGFFFLLVVMSLQTAVRSGRDISFNSIKFGFDILIKHSVVYCIGAFRALDYGIDNFNILQYSYGRFTFLGVDELIYYFCKIIGVDYNNFGSTLGTAMVGSFNIGPNDTFNALFTCVLPFYTDFGLLGIIIFSTSLGVFFKMIMINFLKTKDMYYMMLVLFVAVLSIYSLFTWSFSAPSTYIILIILFIKRKKTR